MRGSLRTALLILALMPGLAGTCLADVRQKGPSGPWVGEVVNISSEPVAGSFVSVEILDATGASYGTDRIATCPSVLMPGERGAFEVFWDPGSVAQSPLSVRVRETHSFPWSGPLGREGLTAREVDRNIDERYVLIELTNTSAGTFSGLEVCANLRSTDGQLSEVGRASLWPLMLAPGESYQFPIFFNTLSSGNVDIFPMGTSSCCASTYFRIPGTAVRPTASRLVTLNEDAIIEIVGEIHNPHAIALDGLTLTAHLKDSLSNRVDRAFVGCNGKVAANDITTFRLWIPLNRSVTSSHEDLVVELAAGYPAFGLYRPPVSNVRLGPRNNELREVSARVTNPTTSWIAVTSGCFNLRDSSGRLVGTSGDGVYVTIAPGGSATVSASVVEIDSATSADVIVFAEALSGPPPTPVPSPQ